MKKLVLIDGNSIMNRAFYGIMGSKALTTKDGKYTNAIYGFLAILFKLLEEETPEYIAVAFDLKAPTARHKLYEGYKANRKGMPEELAEQMPIIKEILRAMNIDIIEKEGYEGDDIIGTLSRYGENQGLEVTILSGDRDTFQLATDKVTIKIPRTKAGKTETELFDREKVKEVYGIEPKQLIEVKGLQGDTSDNIPGVPGIGEKTALSLIQKYGNIDNIYEKLEKGESDLKGKQKEKLEENKDLAFLSRTLGRINLEVPIKDNLEDLKLEEWNKTEVLKIFKELNFKRYIERFNLQEENTENTDIKVEDMYKTVEKTAEQIIEKIKEKACNNRCIPELCNDGCMYGNEKCAFSMAIKTLENQQDIKNALHDKKKMCQNFVNRAYKQEQYARNLLKDEPDREDVKEDLNNVIKLQDRNNALIEFIENLEDILK